MVTPLSRAPVGSLRPYDERRGPRSTGNSATRRSAAGERPLEDGVEVEPAPRRGEGDLVRPLAELHAGGRFGRLGVADLELAVHRDLARARDLEVGRRDLDDHAP